MQRSGDSSANKKRKKLALGRGLDALIPDMPGAMNGGREKDGTDNGLRTCDIALIRPNRYQPRHHFDPEELTQLSESIRAQGILQPLLVRAAETGYELVAGERRLRAAKMAGLQQVPVVVKEVSDAEMLEMSIVENIQREDLNPMEEAEAYHRLMVEFGLTQEQAADRVGKSRSAVANFLRLRRLPEPIKAGIDNGQLSMGHARALLGAETPAQQNAAWRAVVAKGLSVRQTEELIKRLKTAAETVAPKQESSEDRHLTSVAETLARRFGTRVQIKRRGKKGRLELEFYSNEDLNRLLDLLNAL
ncbi:ParB/RepB/Spo0J family partition protein [Desulfatitalea alkaliphila]|uniref:ParB/RepB/Spo0J family partition protein n=1 Tax=Desulfatitalea alkaliphila TaxID=2929485 RepID=A0AA41R465_9BACT|nr:ParB/RepB/Spo0J family partition protein [Desulfatitalea alkaliphila]MCJ8501321.1 ParB/RepB/Spo0J family partition protein [Desulfatitalea alkaliphila]